MGAFPVWNIRVLPSNRWVRGRTSGVCSRSLRGCWPPQVPEHLGDDQVLFLSDILPTGYMGAEMCDIKPGDTIAVWGCGPVGQFAMKSAFLLGAERVIAIDRVAERLDMARQGGAETLNYEEVDIYEALREMTGGVGPDACIDAVGLEAHAPSLQICLRSRQTGDDA